jgi:hypothetical protein
MGQMQLSGEVAPGWKVVFLSGHAWHSPSDKSRYLHTPTTPLRGWSEEVPALP